MTDSLRGARILVPVTSARRDLAERLESLGAQVLEARLIEIVGPADAGALERAAVSWCDGDFDWLAVTSRNAVTALAAAAAAVHRSLGEPLGQSRVAAVGEATMQACADAGLAVDIVPVARQSAAGLVAEFPQGRGTVLTPLGSLAADVLDKGLSRKGWSVTSVEAYRTIDGPGIDSDVVWQLEQGHVDAVILTSGSAAQRLAQQCANIHSDTRIVAIGATTASAAAAAGLVVAATASAPTYDAVVAAVREASK